MRGSVKIPILLQYVGDLKFRKDIVTVLIPYILHKTEINIKDLL